jgi:hypothetical protein
VALGQVCGGHSGTGIGLYWTEWHWDRFVVDRMRMYAYNPKLPYINPYKIVHK